jgi:glutathionyl-hydroquinone reductase
MGILIDGRWSTEWYEPDEDGNFQRSVTSFRSRITNHTDARFKPEAARYHLYISHACPWAHRTLIALHLKGLEPIIGVSVVDPFMGDDGWHFSNQDVLTTDTMTHSTFLRDVYLAAKPDYTGRVTVPILWDARLKTIVNNESREILEIFDDAFEGMLPSTYKLFPAHLRRDINQWLDDMYSSINNGVYKCGFAATQDAYENALAQLFAALERYDRHLGATRYLCGDSITAADWCLFTTLVRFDIVYVGHFKCNLKRIDDYTHLGGYLRDLYQQPGITQRCHLDHIKEHYYRSHPMLNPSRVVAGGPLIDLHRPHHRENVGR